MHITFLEATGLGLGFLAIVAPEFWPKMPRPLSYILAGVGLGWLTYSLILAIQDMTQAKLSYGPIGLIVFGGVCVAGGLFWHISRIDPKPTSKESGSPTHETSQRAVPAMEKSQPNVAPKQGAPQNSGLLQAKVETIVSHGAVTGALEIADSGSILIPARADLPLIKIFEDTDLTIERIDSHVKVSTRFRDKSGKMVAELIRNEWKVAPTPGVWDRNYSNDTLEVKGPDGNIFLQVRVLPDRIQMAGIWYGEETSFFAMSKNPNGAGGIFTIRYSHSPKEIVPPVLKPIFKYPSESHLGERAGN